MVARPVRGWFAMVLGVARYAVDPAGARSLWTLSEGMLADAG
ncbi:hypothetical protein ACWGI8_34250 [Streptomyces sp. NPDC054841]